MDLSHQSSVGSPPAAFPVAVWTTLSIADQVGPAEWYAIETRIRLGNHGMVQKKTDLAELCLLHLGTDPSSWTRDDSLGKDALSQHMLRQGLNGENDVCADADFLEDSSSNAEGMVVPIALFHVSGLPRHSRRPSRQPLQPAV